MSKPRYLYLIEMLTYGHEHPIKVGITKNLEKRAAQLRGLGLCPNVLGYFLVPTRARAQRAETLARQNFPVCPRYGHYSREILAAPFDDLVAFLRPLVRGSALYRPKQREL